MQFHAFLTARVRRLLPVALVSLTVFLVPGIAAAQNGVCRGDPQVWMSDGTKIAISATVGDDASDVDAILYVVHVPIDTDRARIVYTGGVLAGKELVLVVPDSAPGIYTAYTTVIDDSGPTVTIRYQVVTPGVAPASNSSVTGTAINPFLSTILQ